jgi:small subunit ribosomal protein S11
MAQQQQQQRHAAPNRFSDLSDLFEDATKAAAQAAAQAAKAHTLPEPHHFHVYATKHNTHIALTGPNKDAIISLSAGNIGFRKAQRDKYDAVFQLAAYVMKSIQERGLLRAGPDDWTGRGKIRQLEVVLRGFGPDREAVTKALLGTEGRALRSRVVKISDGARLKFGGTRSPNLRRLG